MRWLAAALCLISAPANAALDRAALDAVEFSPLAGAQLPGGAIVHENGRDLPLRDVLGKRPALLIPVDYACRTTCGPALAIASAALTRTGLAAGTDFDLILLGLKPDGPSDEADTFAKARIDDPATEQATHKLTASVASLQAITGALGYRYHWDSETSSFAHPLGAVTLTRTGSISRLLSPLALDSQDLRLALLEAGEGHIGTWAGRLALLCYGFDAAHGVYTARIFGLLQIAGALTVLVIAAWLIGLRRQRAISGGTP